MTCDISPFRHLYPFESHWLDLDGVRMHYVDEGAGSPVVMVHGNPTWSFYFRDLIKELRTTHRVIAPDNVGCGLSDKPDDRDYEYTLSRRVEDLEALLDQLDLGENITLVAHDWGGMIAAACALRRLDRIGRLVFMNTSGFMLPPGQRFPWQLWLIRHLSPLGSLLVRGFNGFAFGATYLATAQGLPADVRRAYRAPYDTWANRIATLRFVQDVPCKPGDRSYELVNWVAEQLERLRERPVMIGWGERDFVFTMRFLAEWRRRLPDAEVHSYPDAGHYVLEDAGADLIPKVRAFIERNTTASTEADT